MVDSSPKEGLIAAFCHSAISRPLLFPVKALCVTQWQVFLRFVVMFLGWYAD